MQHAAADGLGPAAPATPTPCMELSHPSATTFIACKAMRSARTEPRRRRAATAPAVVPLLAPSSSSPAVAASLLVLVLGLLDLASAGNANHNFCGRNWQDASDNCSERQHCPGASDEECPVPGHFCFADTLCDVSQGHGVGVASDRPFAGVPYDDIGNTRFCQSRWNAGMDADCSLENFCGDGSPCPEGSTCHYSDCHVQDAYEAAHLAVALAQKEKVATLDPSDPIRFHACGKSWGDANERCGLWCWGEENECPVGEGCFGNTACYNDAGLGPSASPTTSEPTTRAPTARWDPRNFRYCGKTWDTAVCSIANHCPASNECTNGEVCFTIQHCNILDLTTPPTFSPTTSPTIPHDHPSYYRYCGKNYNHAWSICGPKTFCDSDDDCVAGATCFEDLPEECNAFYMEHPELRKTPLPTMRPTDPVPTDSPTRPVPTRSPTRAPTASPTTQGPTRYLDPKNFMFCGGTWDTVECKEENHCPTGLECTGNQVCFRRPQCNIVDLNGPSASPSSSPISVSDDPANYRFCGATFFDAIDNCSLETHCASGSDASCPTGMHCYDNVPDHCNTFYMTARPTPPPVTGPTTPLRTRRPTPVPAATYLEPAGRPTIRTPRPTDGRDDVEESDLILWCGQDQSEANRNCGSNSFRCVDSVPCPFGWECFEVEDRHCDSLRTPSPTVPQLRPFRPTSHVTETPIPTSGPVGSRTPHSFCGRDLSEATRMCGYHSFSCDSSAHCPIGWECYLVDEVLCEVSSNEGAETPSRTLRPTLSPLGSFTIRPTNVPTEKPWTESPTTKQPTQKPTNMPITSDGDSALPAENFIQTTSKSTSKPTTYRPSKLPTPKPVTYRPTPQPVPVPTTLKPTVLITPLNEATLTMAPTPSPLKESQTSSPSKMPAKYSISKPVGRPKNPSLQSAMNGDSTKEESNSSEEAYSAMEGLDSAATKRSRLYCLSDFGTVDKDCVNAMECSEGNPCPSGYFCIQLFCKSRPSPNGYLDLCPFRFAGRHTRDCKTYYDCDYYGYVGPTYTCREGFKFDKSSSRCIHEYLVNEYCFGAIESFNEIKAEHANTQTFESSNVAMDNTVDSSDESHAESEIDHSTYTFSLTSPPTSLSQTRAPTDIHITPKNLTQQSNSSTVQKDKHDLSTWYEWDRSGANDQSQCLNAHWLGILLPIQFVLVFS